MLMFAFSKEITSRVDLCPSVYQIAEKNLTSKVKQGSKNLRRMMVQVAHTAIHARDLGLGNSI